MTLSQRFEAGPPKTQKPCRARTIAAGLPDSEAEIFWAMVADPKWSDAATYQALRDENVDGLPQTDQFLGYHRRGKCDCPR